MDKELDKARTQEDIRQKAIQIVRKKGGEMSTADFETELKDQIGSINPDSLRKELVKNSPLSQEAEGNIVLQEEDL